MLEEAINRLAREMGVDGGTLPERLAAVRLIQWGHEPVRQYRVGRYRLDFAWPDLLVAIEVDGPHHFRLDTAFRDAYRDAELRSRGWIVLRVSALPSRLEEELARASEVIHALNPNRKELR